MLPRQTALTGKFKQSARMRGRAGGRGCCACVYVQKFQLVCDFGGNSARKREAGFQGVWGSQSSRVRKLCFSLHQPECPHICSASQTPLRFLELLCQSVIQSISLLLPKSRCVRVIKGRGCVSAGAWCRVVEKLWMQRSISFKGESSQRFLQYPTRETEKQGEKKS